MAIVTLLLFVAIIALLGSGNFIRRRLQNLSEIKNVVIFKDRTIVTLHADLEKSKTIPASLCWDVDVFGPEKNALTIEKCRRSRRNVGNPKTLYPFLLKLLDGNCTTVVTIGGSVTCGFGVRNNISNAYPIMFETWLNKKHPCQGLHRVRNLCRRGVSSEHWVSQLQSSKEFVEKVVDADLVLVDTAVNDIRPEDLHDRKDWALSREILNGSAIQKYTEIMYRQLYTVTRGASMIWLTTSWRDSDSRPLGYHTAEDIQDPVLRYYEVPEVSLVQALWPFHSETMRYWASKQLLKVMHPRETGHRMLAQLLGYTVNVEIAHFYDSASAIDSPRRYIEEVPPLYVAAVDISRFMPSYASILVRVDCTLPKISATAIRSTGWSLQEDVPGKPGLITTDVNSTLALAFTVPAQQHVVVALEMLKSYEHMGAFVAAVVNIATNRTVASADVDCLWALRVSVSTFEYLQFDTIGKGSYELRVVVTSSRKVNKIKFMAMMAQSSPSSGYKKGY